MLGYIVPAFTRQLEYKTRVLYLKIITCIKYIKYTRGQTGRQKLVVYHVPGHFTKDYYTQYLYSGNGRYSSLHENPFIFSSVEYLKIISEHVDDEKGSRACQLAVKFTRRVFQHAHVEQKYMRCLLYTGYEESILLMKIVS